MTIARMRRPAPIGGLILLGLLALPMGPAHARALDVAADADPDPSARAEPLQVHFIGNETLLAPVLLHAMRLPVSGPATQDMAAKAQRRLSQWLHDTGYTLARALVFVRDGALEVLLDEGRLERVIFTGAGTLKTLQLRLDFHLPGDVYNDQQVRRELQRLRGSYGMLSLDPSVKRVDAPQGRFLQIASLFAKRGRVAAERLWKRNLGRYELLIRSKRRRWGGGGELNLDYAEPLGLKLKAGYSGSGLAFSEDRHVYRASVAIREITSLGSSGSALVLTEGRGLARWGHPIRDGWVVPFLSLDLRVFNVQRGDLGVDSYWNLAFRGSVDLRFEPIPRFSLELGVGAQFERILDLERGPGAPDDLPQVDRLLPMLSVYAKYYLESPVPRRDRRHLVLIRFLELGIWERKRIERLIFDYRNTLTFGYEELRYELHGVLVEGDGALWTDELPLTNRSMRAVAGGARFARRFAQAGVEARMSLHREYFKLSLFGQGGIFGEVDRETGEQTARGNFAFGPGAHFLILDTFQLDAYFALALRDDARFGSQAFIRFAKVY